MVVLPCSQSFLTDPRSTRSERFRFRVDLVTFFAGQLSKERGKLVNLKEFIVYGNKIEGQLSIRSERVIFADNRHFSLGGLPKELGDLINLKSFDVSYNSIGGQLSIRSERVILC